MRTVNKFIFTDLFFLLAVCALAQAQGGVVRADTTVIAAQGMTVAPADTLEAAGDLQAVADSAPAKRCKVYLIHRQYVVFR